MAHGHDRIINILFQRLQTLPIHNAWSKKLHCIYLTFRMLQRTSSEVTVIAMNNKIDEMYVVTYVTSSQYS